MIRNSLVLLSLTLLLFSCKSVDNQNSSLKNQLNDHSSLLNLEFDCDFEIVTPDQNLNVSSKIKTACYDSVCINLFGPFGIQVGRLYSNKTKFKFHNVFENKFYEGMPSSENLKEVSNINLSFEALIRMMRSEVPGNLEDYKFVSEDAEKKLKLYKKLNKENVEFVQIDENKQIRKYQQKLATGELPINISFNDFAKFDKYTLAKKIILDFKETGSRITITVEDYKVNTVFDKGFDFAQPNNANKIELK